MIFLNDNSLIKIIMLTLYQFPISHYCEKTRWALDYKHLDYRVKNLLPGLHIGTAKKLTGASSLPILVHDQQVVQNSGAIISYLDAAFPRFPLLPDAALQQEVLLWEAFADEHIGIPVRHIFYHVLLDHPSVLIPFYTRNGPWYGSLFFKVAFPKIRQAMRNSMNINAKTSAIAQRQLEQAINKINDHLQGRQFLVGDCFTRADLTTAALLAPLCKRTEYGITWPQRFPEPLENIIEQYSAKLAWVKQIYGGYRYPTPI